MIIATSPGSIYKTVYLHPEKFYLPIHRLKLLYWQRGFTGFNRKKMAGNNDYQLSMEPEGDMAFIAASASCKCG